MRKGSHFFAYLSRMKFIHRWGLMRNTWGDNIQEHSLQVAMIAHALAVIRNRLFAGRLNPERVMLLAVFHEVSEVITGDLASPIKYFDPQIKRAYAEIEDIARKKLWEMIPEELRDYYRSVIFVDEEDHENWQVVKAADKISAYAKCLERRCARRSLRRRTRRRLPDILPRRTAGRGPTARFQDGHGSDAGPRCATPTRPCGRRIDIVGCPWSCGANSMSRIV